MYEALIIILIIVVIVMIPEQDHIRYHLSCLSSSKNKKGLPTPSPIRNKVLACLDHITSNYTIVDFGCGDGEMIDLFQPRFDHVIGIEIDTDQANRASSRFAPHRNVTIRAMDMTTYAFEQAPTVLYLYEPLWTMSDAEATPIYNKVLSNLSGVTDHYLIYVSGIHQQIPESFFSDRGYAIVSHDTHARFFGIARNHIYLLRYQPPRENTKLKIDHVDLPNTQTAG